MLMIIWGKLSYAIQKIKERKCQHIPCLDLLPKMAAHHYLTD